MAVLQVLWHRHFLSPLRLSRGRCRYRTFMLPVLCHRCLVQELGTRQPGDHGCHFISLTSRLQRLWFLFCWVFCSLVGFCLFVVLFLNSGNHCYKWAVTPLMSAQVLSWDMCMLSDSISVSLFLSFSIAVLSNSQNPELANLQWNTGWKFASWRNSVPLVVGRMNEVHVIFRASVSAIYASPQNKLAQY